MRIGLQLVEELLALEEAGLAHGNVRPFMWSLSEGRFLGTSTFQACLSPIALEPEGTIADDVKECGRLLLAFGG